MPVMTRDEIIRYSLLELGKVDAAAPSLETIDANDAAVALNNLLQVWSSLGLAVWKRTEQAFSTVNAQASYAIYPDAAADINAPRPAKIRSVTVDGGPPLVRLTYDEAAEQDPTASGQPKRWVAIEAPSMVTITLFPSPDSTYASTYRYDAPMTEFAAGGDSADIPEAWNEPLILGLAQALAPMYGVPIGNMGPIDARLNALIQGLSSRSTR